MGYDRRTLEPSDIKRGEERVGRADASSFARLLSTGLTGLLIIGVGIAVLSVDVFPVVTNDSVLYLEHSRDLGQGGLVQYGYRQVGYPLFLATTRTVANVFGMEPLLTAVVVQRLLLLIAAFLAWRLWKWWSVPVLALAFSPHILAFANLLLTEALALSLALLLIYPTVRYLRLLGSGTERAERRRAGWLGLAIVSLVVALFSLRFTYAVFAAVPLVLLGASWRTPYRRSAFGTLGASIVLMGVFVFTMAAENDDEFGVFSPNVQGEAVEWYYAWQQVFTLHPENQGNPDLELFYDSGFVHDFNREAGAMGLSHEERSAAYDREVESMFDAAGIDLLSSKAKSALHSLTGGRLHDTGGVINAILASDEVNKELLYLNEYAQREGPEAFEQEHNDGRAAGAIVFGWAVPSPIPSTKALVSVLLPVGLLAMLVGVAFRDTRPLSVMGLLVVVAFAAGMGWIWADNLRFLLPTSAFGIAAGSGVAHDLARLRRRQPV